MTGLMLSGWGITAIIALAIGLLSIFAERRRNRRKDWEKVGFMPWPFIMLMSFLLSVIATVLALKGF